MTCNGKSWSHLIVLLLALIRVSLALLIPMQVPAVLESFKALTHQLMHLRKKERNPSGHQVIRSTIETTFDQQNLHGGKNAMRTIFALALRS